MSKQTFFELVLIFIYEIHFSHETCVVSCGSVISHRIIKIKQN